MSWFRNSPATPSASSAPKRLSRLDLLVATTLGIGYFAILAATSSGIGYVRDEGHYFRAAEVYNRWFEALWDDIAVVHLKSGRSLRGALIRGDRSSGVVLRQRGVRKLVAPEKIARLEVQKNPNRPNVFKKRFIDSIWRQNSEHPVLMKTLFVLSFRLFHEELGWLSQGDAYRLPAWIFAALLIYLLYLFGTELYDRRAGLFAALTVATMPHVFYHAHLACFDVPMVTMWVAVIYCFWKAQRSLYWGITCGPVLALAFATKHNAFFLPFLLVAYYLASRYREFGFPRVDGIRRFKIPPIPIAFFSMVLLTPILYYAHWPYLWNDPILKFGKYIGYHMHHEHYDVPYLGTILKLPPFPWHFPFVMSFFTVPEMTVLLGAIGFSMVTWRQVPIAWFAKLWRLLQRGARRLRKLPPPAKDEPHSPEQAAAAATASSDPPPTQTPAFPYRARPLFENDRIELLLLVGCFVPFAVIAHPKTPVFGGTKHWMQAMPLIALFAAAALAWVASVLAQRLPKLGRRPNVLWGTLACLCLAPSLVGVVRSHPFGTSYHNVLAGGLNGAARLGNSWQFWGGAFRNVAQWLNRHAEKGAGICHHKTNTPGWIVYQRDGIVRKDLVGLTGMGRECRWNRADYYVYQHQPEYQNDEVQTWHHFGTVMPVHVIALDGMPLVSIYRKKIRFQPGSVVRYGTRQVGTWKQQGQAIALTAWRGRKRQEPCEGVYRDGTVTVSGRPPANAADNDDAFRTLLQLCYNRRLPR